MKDRYIHAAFVTDASGVAIQHLEYMALGEVFVDERRTGFGTPYKFNAKELDCESGYYYYSARYYDPRMARFLSVDPLAGEFPSQSSYLYAYNNQVRMIDVDGLYGDESEANRQRDLAQAQGHDVGKVYKSGDEWGFNTIDGYDSKGTFERDFSQNNTNHNGGAASAVSMGSTAIAAYKEYNVSGGKFRGASGNYYSYKGRQGWNQYTGTKDHMKTRLSTAKHLNRLTKGLGVLNAGISTDKWVNNDLTNTAFGIEIGSTLIGTFAPPIISIPWTLGYEGLGRYGITRFEWYQSIKRKVQGVEGGSDGLLSTKR